MRVLAAMTRRRRLGRGRGAGRRRRARRRRRAPGAVADAGGAARRARGAAARRRTRATRGAPPTCSASRSTSGTSRPASPPTSSTTSWPPTPRARPPTRACAATRRSSSRRCWTGRSRSGSTRSCTGHYARLVRTAELRRAVDADKDQSYVLAVLTAEQLRHAMFPLGDTAKADVRAEAAARGLRGGRQAGQPRHLLHPLRRHPRRSSPRGSARARARSSTPTPAPSWAATTACTASPSASASGLGVGAPAADGRPRYVLGIEPVSGTVRVGPRDGAGCRATIDARAARCGRRVRAPGPFDAVVQVRAHGGLAQARVEPDGARVRAELTEPLRGVAPGQAVAFYVGDAASSAARRSPRRLTPPRRVSVFRDGESPFR